MVVLAWTPHLKMFHEDAQYMDEYRIKAGKVEVRALDANGNPYPGYSEWLQVTPEEIKLHFVRHTEVAQWLKKMLAESVTDAERCGRRKAG